MTELLVSSCAVKSLTKRTKDTNELYRRRPEVELQIEKILSLEDGHIFSRLENQQRDQPNYLFDETLIYLMRERRDDRYFVENLFMELNRRILKLIGKFRRYFKNTEDFEDFKQKVLTEIIDKVIKTESDIGDYAQVNFGDFVIKSSKMFGRAHLKNLENEREHLEMKRSDSEDGTPYDEDVYVSAELSIDEKIVLRSRLAQLPENILQAAVLHYLDGWQIESKDSNAATVCKYFNVSSRTIRNWLAQAKEILAAQEGVKI